MESETPTTVTAIIEATGLSRTFQGSVRAVDRIDLAVEEGEIFGFIGLNGAGKSTTIRMLTTLLRPTAGTARIAGHDVVREPDRVRREIGVALQDAGVDPHATGREFLEFGARLYGLSGSQASARAAELLDAVGLSDAAGKSAKTYSGGMQRRLDLASALVHRPRILFLDEPTTGLDPVSRQDIWEEVRRLNREEGQTIFLTSHYLEEVDRLANRVAIIDKGRIVEQGTPASLKARLGHEVVQLTIEACQRDAARLTLGQIPSAGRLATTDVGLSFAAEDGVRTLTDALSLLNTAGITVGSVSMERPTLDDVFLQATGTVRTQHHPA
jgi:ABC-2 type transport system ATP-binding protein